MHSIPHIPGSKQVLSPNLTVSILIDRTLIFEVGKSVLLILGTDEARELYLYLHRNKRKFISNVGGGK
jgi:hypothetical protein